MSRNEAAMKPNSKGSKLKTPVLNLAGLEKPEQMLDLVQNPNIRDLISVITMAQGVLQPDDRPEWVLRSANEFWRCCIDFPKTKRAKSEEYRIGYQWGLFGRYRSKGMEREPAMLAVLNSGQMDQLFHTAIREADEPKASDFYAGFSDGLKRSGTFSPSSPWLVYLLLTVMRREAEKLKNTNDVHLWLESVIGRNMTGSRERVAKLLQKIRFPLTDKGGRPKTKPRNPTAK